MAKRRIVATGKWSNPKPPAPPQKREIPEQNFQKPENSPEFLRQTAAMEGVPEHIRKALLRQAEQQESLEKREDNNDSPAPGTAPDKKGLLAKAKAAAQAYASKGLSGKRAKEDVVEIRSMSCHGLPDIGLPPCEFRGNSVVEEGRHYCLECGCGDRAQTWLNSSNPDDYTKLHFPKVQCPLHMPGFSNYSPVELETQDRIMHYKGFERKKSIENYCQTMGVNLVELSVGQTDE